MECMITLHKGDQMMRFLIGPILMMGAFGCTNDPAKVLEAKSMAICGCENIKCVQAVDKQFAHQKQSLDRIKATPEQTERAKIAAEKIRICMERIAKASP